MKDDVVKINYGDVVTTMRSFNAGKNHYGSTFESMLVMLWPMTMQGVLGDVHSDDDDGNEGNNFDFDDSNGDYRVLQGGDERWWTCFTNRQR